MSTMREPQDKTSVPCDIDAERRVLGILIKHPHLIDTAVDRLTPAHFFEPQHRAIFEVIYDIYSKGGRVSYTRVYNQLRKEKKLAAPDEALIQLTEAFASEVELLPSIESLVEKEAKRRILRAAQEIQRMILNETEESLDDYISKAQQLIFEATNVAQDSDEIKDLMTVLNKCYLRLVERREGRKPYGLPVRFPAIDVMTTGFKNKDLIILAARPSMGKTSLALNFAVNVAKRGLPVLIFSLEMDDEQIGDRIVMSEFIRFRRPDGSFEITPMDYSTRLNDEQFEKAQSIYNEMYDLPIFIIDKRGLSVVDIRAKARKVKAEHPNLALIIIDYLQLIKPPPNVNKNWALVVGDIVRELRDLAGELDLPIILLSQLNRSVEQRENKRPVMSDLRDSGNIEEFADVVMFLYREDYYYPEQAKENGTEGQVEVIFAKQRKGPTGSAKLRFIKEFTRFVEETDRTDLPV
ncbi:MAG: replicative DNA helicase [Clostridia bacterium]|nr:replicative DNA helicase [Bacillota bacterium]MBO2521120.1 replicative DNA helicase [Bacillota bacterium]